MAGFSGGCLCGQLRYRVTADPITTAICHCKNCQKQGGAAFSVNVVVLSAAVTVTGTLKVFQDRGESGGAVMREFCPECGSPIFSRLASNPAIAIVKAGTLDDPAPVQPAVQVWTGSAQPWVRLDPALPGFEKNPPG